MNRNNKIRSPKNGKRERQVVSFVEELKSEVATFFEINNEKSFSLTEILEHFEAEDTKIRLILDGILQDLRDEDRILRQLDGQFRFKQAEVSVLVGKVDHVNKNFAFVVLDGQDDVWVDGGDLNGAIDGDTVQVTVFSDSKRKKRKEGRVEKVIARGRTEYVGTIEIFPRYAIVEIDNRRIYGDVYVSKNKSTEAESGDKVLVKITNYATQTLRMEGEISDVLGKSGDNNTEMHAILAEFGLPYKFSDELEAEAAAISEIITEEEISRRRDMRSVLTFTIDPADAKDFDDALSIQFLENGNIEIGVHIADVSHYIKMDSELEKEAYSRATSVYLVDRTVPMLPEKLSNNLCSLRPNEDKLTFSAIFEMTPEAKIKKEWFGRTIIHSDKRFSYEDAQEVLDNQAPLPPEGGVIDSIKSPSPDSLNHPITKSLNDSPNDSMTQSLNDSLNHQITKSLNVLNSLAYKLREERFEKGSINFETVEVKFKLDENGKPLGVYQKARKDTHKLIEEFMLLANKRVAEFVHSKSKDKTHPNTMIYRVHEEPNLERLRVFAAFATKLGYAMKVEDESQAAKSLNGLMASIEGKPEQNVLEQLAVRTMAKARYTTEDLGHFGLAFRRYSHFTSPIRRYPDVMAHRLLQHYIDGKPSPDIAWYEAACKRSSEREKMASDAERASIKYKQVEFMSLMDTNKVWDGLITGVTDFGIFVEIIETSCEGLIRMTDLNDDHYELDKENYRLVGQRSHKVYSFGDALKVTVKETNIARRSMDLSLADAKPAGNRGGFKKDYNRGRSNERGSKPKRKR